MEGENNAQMLQKHCSLIRKVQIQNIQFSLQVNSKNGKTDILSCTKKNKKSQQIA